MHDTTMVFLVGMPFPFGFANYNTYYLVEFLHDVLKVREFPWLLSEHKTAFRTSCFAIRA